MHVVVSRIHLNSKSMGNLLALCAIGGSVFRGHESMLRVLKVYDGKILEFRASIKVKDLLMNYPNSYVGLFREATQPLPLEYKLKIGKIYYLLPCFPTIKIVSTSLLCPVSQPKDSGGVRIKMVITKQQFRQLLLSNEIRVGTMLLGIDKKLGKASTHLQKLESIVEETECMCGRMKCNRIVGCKCNLF